jgi:predicted MPP superfamily phosphohydrolase
VRYLRNELVELAPRLRLLGLTASASRRPLSPEHLAEARAFDGLSIVLGHAPDFAAALLDGSGPPLVCFAGHTHGGQVVIPGFGPPLTLSSLPRRYASGLHRLGDAWLLVSRGVGMERAEAPRVRLFCPPELPVLELSGSDPP